MVAGLHAVAAQHQRRLSHQGIDLASEESIAEAVTAVLAAGRVDILVNNAGTQIRHDAVEFPLEDFDTMLAVNLRSVFQLCQGFGAPMVQRGDGKIVNLASLLSFQGGFRVPAYAAAKGAVAQLTKALANEWAGKGVNVNAIAPGFIETRLTAAIPFTIREVGRRLCSLSQGGLPVDIAEAITFFASPGAAGTRGNVLRVCGGNLLGA